MQDFLPHQLNPFQESDLKLYHVYDGLSQTLCDGINLRSIHGNDWRKKDVPGTYAEYDVSYVHASEAG